MQPRENNDPRTQQSGLIYEGAVEEYGNILDNPLVKLIFIFSSDNLNLLTVTVFICSAKSVVEL